MRIETQVQLQTKNTLNLPCVAAAVAYVSNAEEVRSAMQYAQNQQLPIKVLGGGSNVILPPRLQAMVLHPVSDKLHIEATTEQYLVRVDAAHNWHQLVQSLLSHGIFGLENLALIPGQAGASVIQNIGAYGIEVGQFIDAVEVIDCNTGEVHSLRQAQCQFAYRDSIFKQQPNRWLVLSITLKLPKAWRPHISYPALQARLEHTELSAQAIFDAVISLRQQKLPDPAQLPNAGSFFKNPVVSQCKAKELLALYPNMPHYPQANSTVKLAAGWLIEQCGWKGRYENQVGMYEQQALVLVNQQEQLTHVEHLYHQVMAACMRQFGVELEPEPVRF